MSDFGGIHQLKAIKVALNAEIVNALITGTVTANAITMARWTPKFGQLFLIHAKLTTYAVMLLDAAQAFYRVFPRALLSQRFGMSTDARSNTLRA